MKLALLASLLGSLSACATAFAPVAFHSATTAPKTRSPSSALFLSHWEDDESAAGDDAMEANKARTCILNFLTQRAFQSFIFLLNSCRDPHTVQWLESAFDVKNLAEFHGLGAFNMTNYGTWDAVFLDLLARPKDVVIIESRPRKPDGGWRGPGNQKRKPNPFLQNEIVEYHHEIDPLSLMSRLLSVRDQLSKEFTVDLDTLISANELILTSYKERQEHAREQKDDDPEVQDLLSPYSENKSAFDRHGMYFLSNSMSGSIPSSPIRQGNFDLLFLLATQESVHRVLRQYRDAGAERDISYLWLREFYKHRVSLYFDGNQKYGRADDFLEELLLIPPSVKKWDGELVGLIDPMRIAEDIIEMRSQVASDWKDIIAEVPKQHMDLRNLHLARAMFDAAPATSEEPEAHVEKVKQVHLELVELPETVGEFE